ncbi:MAG: nicotinate-nucleotide adenylyltransferase [Pseudomonadota bacterium]|nr:nicotinate-nucleotide adenylyltransferase [Pseudomonadota bacterium]
MKRIGLFGGSFDPVHNAHLALAQAALEQLALDELRWIPAGQPWQKSRLVAAAADREAMVRLAIAAEPRFVLERFELEQAGTSYSVDTVRSLQRATPRARWWLVIGADQYARFTTWHEWQALLGLATLAVAGRPGTPPAAASVVPPIPFVPVMLPAMPDSATAVRARLEAGEPIDDLVPPAVARYIEQHRLYAP